MRDLNLVAKECLKEMDAISIPYGEIKEFVVNTRAKKRWGQCKKVSGGYSINISFVLLDERNSLEGLKNTIIHEILHTCKGCLNHGQLWKKYAAKVNRHYGYNIKRCSSSDEKGLEVDTRIECQKKSEEIKHQFQCCNYGQIVSYKRESKFTKNYDKYVCGICRGEFIKIF